jgi:hypothetical protein
MVQITGNIGKLKRWINKRIRIPSHNTFAGENTGTHTTGDHNTFAGKDAGFSNTTGEQNNFIGQNSGYSNTVGNQNNFIGRIAGFSNTTGDLNCYFGSFSGYTNTVGSGNLSLGNYAGYYETGDNKLFIDNTYRANEADARIKALIYGVFAAATANQRLSINARLLVREVATYTNDAAAGTGGLVAGEIYKHADGSLHIKL